LAQQNQKASRNGRLGENYASIMYQTEIATNAIHDGTYNGAPLEVKTCMNWITDAGNSRARRRGRFYLPRFQHAALLRADGNYAFFVIAEDGALLFAKLVTASFLEEHEYVRPRGTSQIVWTHLFPEVSY
ncbi:MAG: hypothetical protein PHQ43_06210, partial [Dehalococcoidales bacterium]|nr:hypothetical protein [Dehalococcoidales bacterium]